MAKKRRLSPNDLAELKGNFAGLKTIGNYAPLKSEFGVNPIQTVETELDEMLVEEAQMMAQLAELRDRIADKGTEFSQKMKGARQQTIAQFGDDSPEVQKVGRKRTSERASPKPKPVE